MKLKDITKKASDINKMGHSIENNIIKYVNVNTIAHFGNVTCFEIVCSDVCAMSGYNNIGNLGYLIKSFIELFDLSEEDGLRLTKIKDVPCRLVLEGNGGFGSRCIGFGNFMKDKFVLTDEFAKINE